MSSWTYRRQETDRAWRAKNKDKVKENKKRWRERQKEEKHIKDCHLGDNFKLCPQCTCPNCGGLYSKCNGNCIFEGLPNKGF